MYNAAEAQVAADVALAYEFVRSAVRDEIRRTSERDVAHHLRVRVVTLQRFLEGGVPKNDLWARAEALAFDRPPPFVTVEDVAATLIVETLPPSRRAEVRRRLMDAMRPVLEREGRRVT